MGATIKDIAKLANVSTTTVSRVINNKAEGVSDATRKRILDIIEELHYQPNALARGLITKKTKTIGLILPDITNPFFPNLARGVEDMANKNGYNIFLCNTDNKPYKENEYINLLKEKCVDGIIITSSSIQKHEHISKLMKSGIPIVMADRRIEHDCTYGIFLDNYEGGYIATKHLIELGHKNIGCITGPLSIENSVERLQGYKQALLDFNIDFNKDIVVNGDYKILNAMDATKKLLSNQDVTAIFACNDLMAYGAYKVVREKGLKIPDDMSIVGFDDVQLSQIIEPQLTTIKQPIYDMGIEASKLLIKLIEGKKVKKKVTKLSTSLVIRKSTKSINES